MNTILAVVKGVLTLPLLQKIFLFTLSNLHCAERNLNRGLVEVDINCGSPVESNVALDNIFFFSLRFSVFAYKIEINM